MLWFKFIFVQNFQTLCCAWRATTAAKRVAQKKRKGRLSNKGSIIDKHNKKILINNNTTPQNECNRRKNIMSKCKIWFSQNGAQFKKTNKKSGDLMRINFTIVYI